MPPTLAAGKLAYLLITVDDVERAAAFYAAVLGWDVRRKDDGRTAFDDGCSEVSGHFTAGQPPAGPPGILVNVLVRDVAATLESAVAAGGAVDEPPWGEPPELYARLRDPAGNVVGIFEQGGW